MSSVAHSPPEQGQLVSARSRQWVVNDVRPSTLPPPALNNPVDFGKSAFLVCRDLDQFLPGIERLKRYAKLARKRGREQQERAEMEVRMTPVRYAFAQEVTLYRREPGEVHSPANGTGGWTVSPHWRRGHCTPRSSWLERANGLRPGSSTLLYRREVRRWGVAAW